MEKNSVGISFCIPVYNAEKYLKECIDSILAQDFSDFEIVCIDDCSTDGSYEMLKLLEKEHPQIHVFRNDANHGVSFTRNETIRLSQGKYLWFVDPDDYMVPDTVGLFYKTAEEKNADALWGRCIWFPDGTSPADITGTDEIKKVTLLNPDEYYQHDQFGNNCLGVWLGLFKRQSIIGNGLKYNEELPLMEDFLFFYEFGFKNENIYHIDHYGYYYRGRSVSASHSEDDSVYKRYFAYNMIVTRICKEHAESCGPKWQKTADAHLALRKTIGLMRLLQIKDRKYIQDGRKRMKKEGYYPFRYNNDFRLSGGKTRRIILFRKLICHEYLFWPVYFAKHAGIFKI